MHGSSGCVPSFNVEVSVIFYGQNLNQIPEVK
jgi:hypothetical protein